MTEITAQMVKDLRDRSGVGPIDCKRALVLCQGDIEVAYEWLRKLGTQLFDWNNPPYSTWKEYQQHALETANYDTGDIRLNIAYTGLGLAGEAGEVANKIKKHLRGDISFDELKPLLLDELGDVLWYMTMLAQELELTLDEVSRYNVKKLAGRKTRGVIKGSGDNR